MNPTIMAQEAAEAPARIREQLAANSSSIAAIVGQINQRAPKYVYMVGRGSSDHAGVFAKYLIEIEIGSLVLKLEADAESTVNDPKGEVPVPGPPVPNCES